MYLRDLHIRNFKLLKDFQLSFSDESGKPRMWTVILGENGTGKTSILQAIALAAAGERNLSGLGANVSSLPDKRAPKEPLQIDAAFSLDARHREQRSYPGLPGKRVTGEVLIDSNVTLQPGAKTFRAHSLYRTEKTEEDPIDAARTSDEKFWFVAAYGIQRFLPRDPTQRPTLEHASIDRLRPAFQPVDLVGTNFANILRGKKATMYAKVLRQTLFGVEDLLPGFRNLELRGQGGARTAQHIQESHRFIQKLPSGDLKLAASWLSHGYQSTIAWIADLVGQILWEAKATEPLDASEMEGLVLIDEIDLYLHPRWQRTLIRTLKAVFPRIQFVATTHSPLALLGLRPDEDEIVRLAIDPNTGNVVQFDLKKGAPHEPDPRLMTGSELYRSFFGIEQFYPDDLGAKLREHRYLAADPGRTGADDKRLRQLESDLRKEGVQPDIEPVPKVAS